MRAGVSAGRLVGMEGPFITQLMICLFSRQTATNGGNLQDNGIADCPEELDSRLSFFGVDTGMNTTTFQSTSFFRTLDVPGSLTLQL